MLVIYVALHYISICKWLHKVLVVKINRKFYCMGYYMFNYYLKYWLDLVLADETKAHLSGRWDDKSHPSIVPTDKLYPNPYLKK